MFEFPPRYLVRLRTRAETLYVTSRPLLTPPTMGRRGGREGGIRNPSLSVRTYTSDKLMAV
jgi:hypothetical protein